MAARRTRVARVCGGGSRRCLELAALSRLPRDQPRSAEIAPTRCTHLVRKRDWSRSPREPRDNLESLEILSAAVAATRRRPPSLGTSHGATPQGGGGAAGPRAEKVRPGPVGSVPTGSTCDIYRRGPPCDIYRRGSFFGAGAPGAGRQACS
eukprot:scaffold12889_cov105-Isochrysis_galbana.AAC.1